MSYVIGIDGGGTKTVAVVADAAASLVGRAEGGPSNYQTLGIEAVEAVLRSTMAAAASQAGGGSAIPVVALCLGMAGVDRPADHAALESVVQALLGHPPQGIQWRGATRRHGDSAAELSASPRPRVPGAPAPTPAPAVLIVNDAVIALVGGAGRKLGVVQVAGTGSIAFGMNARGEQRRAGGWGYLLGDEGSGYAIGRAGLQTIARAHDGRGPRTRLTDLVLARHGLEGPEQLIGLAYGAWGVPEVAAVARLVDEAAAAGDEVALVIIREAAAELALCATTVIRSLRMEQAQFDVVTVGGVWQGRSGLREAFTRAVVAAAPAVTVLPPRHEPAYGAALLGLEAAGVH